MKKKGNKGERSEIYVVLKLAADGRLAAADSALNPRADGCYRLLKIILPRIEKASHSTVPATDAFREIVFENPDENTRGNAAPAARKIFVRNSTENLADASGGEFAGVAAELLRAIKNSAEAENLADFLKKKSLAGFVGKMSNDAKSDLKLEVSDPWTSATRRLGFSIKSYLGAAPTLINASRATRLEFRLGGNTLSPADIEKFNAMLAPGGKTDWRRRFNFLREKGVTLEFSHCTDPIYQRNLMLVDSAFPRVLAELVKNYFSSLRGSKKFVDALAALVESDPLGLNKKILAAAFPHSASHTAFPHTGSDAEAIYGSMMKRFLRAHSLGMNAHKPWNGRLDASGGIIVVRTDGKLVSFFAYNFNELDEFLFRSAAFDTPSASRHDYGKIVPAENTDGRRELVLRLNFQVRDIARKTRDKPLPPKNPVPENVAEDELALHPAVPKNAELFPAESHTAPTQKPAPADSAHASAQR